MAIRGALTMVMDWAGACRACDFCVIIRRLSTTWAGVAWPSTASLQTARAATANLSMENCILRWRGEGGKGLGMRWGGRRCLKMQCVMDEQSDEMGYRRGISRLLIHEIPSRTERSTGWIPTRHDGPSL